MFLCLHTHSNLIIFLAVEHLHALLFHDQLPVGWGEKDCVEGEQNRRRASTQAPLLYGNLQVKYRCHYTAAQTTAKTTSAKEPLCTQIYRSKPDAKKKAAQATSKKQHVKTPFYTAIYRKNADTK